MGSRVVMRSRCLGAWSIPGVTEVLSVIIMARKRAVKTHHALLLLAVLLLQDLEPALPISPRKTGASLEVILAAAMPGHHGQRGCVERRGAQRDQSSTGELGLVHMWPRRL